MRKDTRIHLVEELRKLTPPVELLEFYAETLQDAVDGEYHDYKNKKHTCGKVAVVSRLQVMGFDALADRVITGEFDEEADEVDKAMLRKDCPRSMWKALGLEET